VQEASRRARRRDSPFNSAAGGAAAGALLFAAHGRPVPQGAIVCAAIGAGGHAFSDWLGMEGGIKGLLISLDLLDEDAEEREAAAARAAVKAAAKAAAAAEDSASNRFWSWAKQYAPLTKMSDAEWAAHQRLYADKMEAAAQGGRLAVEERRRREAETQGDGGASGR
jgi:hypothetical protein